MLPDFTKAREQAMKILLARFNYISGRYLGKLDFKKYRIFEGKLILTIMDDGKIIKTEVQKLSGEIQILNDDVKSGNIQKAYGYIDKMAIDKAEKQISMAIKELIRITTETGQVTDNKGKPFDSELFFKALEGIDIDFKEDGTFDSLTFLIPPEITERVNQVLKELESNPDHKIRYDAIIERKRLEWRDRETSRKLVG